MADSTFNDTISNEPEADPSPLITEDPVIDPISTAIATDPSIKPMTTSSDPSSAEPNPLVDFEPIEEPVNPIIEIMKQYSKIALLICPLPNDYAKTELISNHGFCEENIIIIADTDCTRDNILKMLNTIIGSSNLLTYLLIYYSGYGNRIINSGVIDNLMKIIVPYDASESPIGQDELVPLLQQSVCNTVCLLDLCPPTEMLLKWSVDTMGPLKIITLSESKNTNKFSRIRSVIIPTKI